MNIEENTKLIAEFMGLLYSEAEECFITSFNEYVNPDYGSSWDELMPVIKKIRGIANTFEFDTPENDKFEDIFSYAKEWFMFSDIDSVYESAIEFIKWHNENK